MESSSYYDLISGQVVIPSKHELQHEEQMTAMIKHDTSECGYECCYTEPYGWVPEAGCPVHD